MFKIISLHNIKPGSKDMLDVFGVTCNGIKSLFPSKKWYANSARLICCGSTSGP